MTNLDQFISENHIRMEVEYADSNPNMASDDKWMASAHHYRCTLKRKGKQLTIPFSQGSAHTEQPTAADVLDCLASDATGIVNARSFEDWCSEYGYDTDSRKAEKTYNTCRKQAERLEAFLGQESYKTLLWNCERL